LTELPQAPNRGIRPRLIRTTCHARTTDRHGTTGNLGTHPERANRRQITDNAPDITDNHRQDQNKLMVTARHTRIRNNR
jgi:hypothetical protein